MNDRAISTDRSDPDDAPSLGEAWFAEADLRSDEHLVRRGRPRADVIKQAVSLRLDEDVIAWFKQSGSGWQTRMNEALRRAANL